eukprot:5420240-Prymnesium_polylepis.1
MYKDETAASTPVHLRAIPESHVHGVYVRGIEAPRELIMHRCICVSGEAGERVWRRRSSDGRVVYARSPGEVAKRKEVRGSEVSDRDLARAAARPHGVVQDKARPQQSAANAERQAILDIVCLHARVGAPGRQATGTLFEDGERLGAVREADVEDGHNIDLCTAMLAQLRGT